MLITIQGKAFTHQKGLSSISKLHLSSFCVPSEKHRQVVRHFPSTHVKNSLKASGLW